MQRQQRVKPAPWRRRRKLDLGDGLRLAATLLVIGLALAAMLLRQAPGWVLAVYLLLSAISAAYYAFDKRAAETERWRVPEMQLHLLDAIGGIPGGLLAQLVLRHKTRKPVFIARTAIIAVTHILLLAPTALGLWRLPPELFFL